MPLSLLLQETVYTFRWGAHHLEPWVNFVRTEELLIDRARSAFLVHWFGSGLPLQGFFVKIVLQNLKELRTRYYQVLNSVAPSPWGPNLTEPLAGLIGEIAGMVFSPTTVLLATAWIVRKLPIWVQSLGFALGSLAALVAPPIAVLVGVLLFPIALLGGVGFTTSQPDDVRKIYALLGATALLLIAAGKFIRLLLGPRENIKNPLLRDVLGLLDQLAGLLPFVLAFVAVVVTRIGPLLEPLASQIQPFAQLISAVGDASAFLVGDIPGTFSRYLPLLLDQVDFVLVQLTQVLPVFAIVFTELFTNLGEELTSLVHKTGESVTKWKQDLKKIVIDSPLSVEIKKARIVFGIAASELSSGTSSSSSSGSSSSSDFPKLKLTKPEDFLRFKGGAPPGGLDAIDTLAKIDLKYGGALFGDRITYSKAAQKGAAAARRSTNVFGAERAELLGELGARLPSEALKNLRDKQLELRDLLTTVVGRILPPALRVEMGKLINVFQAIDEHLYEIKLNDKAEQLDYPIRDLPDNGQLVPVVHRLVIRGGGLTRVDAEAFQARLQQAMNALRYPAASPALAGGLAESKG